MPTRRWKVSDSRYGRAGFRMMAADPQGAQPRLGRRLVDRRIDTHAATAPRQSASIPPRSWNGDRGMYERAGFVRCPKYDIYASSILGFDRTLGDELVIAYELPLAEALDANVAANGRRAWE
jgi:hypothetical protein